MSFLGYIIQDGTITPGAEKIQSVKEFPIPRDKKGIQRFLGLTSYFRKFINGYATVARPLSDLLRNESKYEFGEKQQVAFEKLKLALISEPVLKLYDPNLATEIHTDASKYGFGAVLLQKDPVDSMFHPVQYMSRKTTPFEEKYDSYELEVLAIIGALVKWRIYVLGINFTIVTDCNAFKMTMNKKEVPLRVARWALYLQDFNYKIEHRSGLKMKHADALSRVSCNFFTDALAHRLKTAQLNDDWIKAVRSLVGNEGYEDFYIQNDILMKDQNREQVVVPSIMENEIISNAHSQGHFSAKKTIDLIEKSYFIPKLKDKVNRIINGCVRCIIVNAKSGKKEGFLTSIDKGNLPFVTYHVDHVGPMELTNKRYNHILVVVDGFSKYVWLYPTRSTGVDEVLNSLEKQAINFGNPHRIVSDRGTAFTSHAFREYCESNNIQHLLIATGVPRGNGQVERLHKLVVPMLSKFSYDSPTAWYKYVGKVQQIINSTEPRSTKVTPFKLLTGVDMRLADSSELRELINEFFVKELDQEREQIRSEARENIRKLQEENKRDFDLKRKKEKEYKVNDLVAIKRTQYGVGLKLKGKFLGPYKVVATKEHGRYEVERVGDTEGPFRTSTVSEYMKPWPGPFEANVPSGGPNVGFESGGQSGKGHTRSGASYMAAL